MARRLFGELLGQFVKLSSQDVSEILEDQSASRRRFGEIALAYGLCKPQHVWKAWWAQLPDEPQRVDLGAMGVDVQSLALVPRALALEYGVVPLRACGQQMVLAVSDGAFPRAAQELPRKLRMDLKFVLADASQVQKAIQSLYPVARQDPVARLIAR